MLSEKAVLAIELWDQNVYKYTYHPDILPSKNPYELNM